MPDLKPAEIAILSSLQRSPKRPMDLSEELEIARPNISNYLSSLALRCMVEFKHSEENKRERIYYIKERE